MKLTIENVALVYIELPDANVDQDIYELSELIHTAGGEIKSECRQKRNFPDPDTIVGKGKLDELKATLQTLDCDIDVVVFSCPLNAAQRSLLKKQLDCDVIDKIDLILDIFALRASSAEGKKQVELAQLTYNLATKPEGDFSRQGAGIGTRGPGETKLDTNKRRALTRKQREDNSVFTVALVGYTNAGKSTLFNRLTRSDVYADDKLFATLDTTVRRVALPCGVEILLCDTVGFIKELPHALLNAFKSTLEETATADLLLNVCDVSDENVLRHIAVTEQTLAELGAAAPVIRVYNKCDKATAANIGEEVLNGTSIFVSAQTGKNIDLLLDTVQKHVMNKYSAVTLKASYSESAALLSDLNKYNAQLQNVEYKDDCVSIKAIIAKKYLGIVAKYLTF